MNKDLEKYHGLVVLKIIRATHLPISFTKQNSNSYIINKKFGLYIKYSSKRISPWTFTFRKEHQDEISLLKKQYSEVFICLVCHNDGVVCLTFKELKLLLDYNHTDEWVRVSRRPRSKYSIHGSDGQFKNKKGNNEFPRIILDAIKQTSLSAIKKAS